MFDIISKTEYWRWLDDGVTRVEPSSAGGLKHIQDAFILSLLADVEGKAILEFGGGHSRVLKRLSRRNECWNADRFEGAGNGPLSPLRQRGVKTVRTFLGEMSPDLPEGHFDYVFSISVLEHVPNDGLPAVFADAARVLKPGGSLIQAIDLYIPDADETDAAALRPRSRLAPYLAAAAEAGLALKEPAAIGADAVFRARYATNSDTTMYKWTAVAPKMRPVRELTQSVAVKAWWLKPAT